MPISRRGFLRYASAFSLGSLLPAVAVQQAVASPFAPDEGAGADAYWRSVRSAFPLSSDWAYLNTGTIGPSPYPVIEAIRAGMMETDTLGHYNGYEDLPKKLAAFLGADEGEIALTHNTTEGINIMCRGVPLQRGDEVLLSTHEHAGNAFPWLNRARQEGIVLKTFSLTDTASNTLSIVGNLITKRTRAIAIPHLPCTQGQVLPLAEICSLARRRNIFTLIDGAHGAGMMQLDLHGIGADAYAGCCHKWMLGPKGTGFLYVRKEFQAVLKPHFVGAGGDTGTWNMATHPITDTEYAAGAHRYWGGTQNLGLWLGVGAAIDFLSSIGMKRIEQRVRSLADYCRAGLASYGDRVELLTPAETRSYCGITGFRIRGAGYKDFFNDCMAAKVRIRAVSENDWNALRVSTHFFNTTSDIDRLLEQVKKAL